MRHPLDGNAIAADAHYVAQIMAAIGMGVE